MSSAEEIASTFLTAESVLSNVNGTLSAMFVVYGFYILLFGISVKILCKRHKERPQRMVYLGWTVTLFILVTITNAFEGWWMIQQQRIYFEAVRTKAYDELLRYLHGSTPKTVAL
ncbi:hypothetical protein VNI00_013056 [Paramarasmius palmivorus]|uniref:Uncharacterized protein n=1 Tax=Paramarasmius palmivorus TaxID=297713 RepID=A0AAW0BZK9_9AGAR